MSHLSIQYKIDERTIMKFVLSHILAVYLKLIIFLALLLIGKTAYSQSDITQADNPISTQAIQVIDTKLDSYIKEPIRFYQCLMISDFAGL